MNKWILSLFVSVALCDVSYSADSRAEHDSTDKLLRLPALPKLHIDKFVQMVLDAVDKRFEEMDRRFEEVAGMRAFEGLPGQVEHRYSMPVLQPKRASRLKPVVYRGDRST